MSGKPLGIDFVINERGLPSVRVSPINRVTDQIWDAVREAINANMTPAQFKSEVSDAWCEHLRQDAKDAAKELSR